MERAHKSFVENLDPRTKLLALLIFAAGILLTNSFWVVGSAIAVVVAGMIVSPISLREATIQLRRVFWFSLFVIVINAFTVSGTVIAHFWQGYATVEGVIEGIMLALRLAALLLLSYLFAKSTTIAGITEATEALLSPLRKYAAIILTLFSMTLNFVPLIIRAAHRIKAAHLARGADIESSFLKRVKFASQASLPIFVTVFRSSHHLAEAMDSRCYDPHVRRPPLRDLKMTFRDWCVLSGVVLFSLIFLLDRSL